MKMQSFQYIQNKGWSVENFPDLDSENTLIFIFASPLFFDAPAPIHELFKHYQQSKIMGCSTAGEIFGGHLIDESLSVVVIQFKNTSLKMTNIHVNQINDSLEAGKSIANQLNAENLRAIFVLSEGLTVNGSELVKGLNEAVNPGVIITGGLAGDGSHFNKTWTIFNDTILKNQIVAVGLYSDVLCVGHASQGGWDIFGPVRRVTRSEGNVLYELDYTPALRLYKEYLGDKAADLPASGLLFPLAITDPSALQPTVLVRTILAIDEKAQSLIFAGDIPRGFNAQLMRGNLDRLIESANKTGEQANQSMWRNGHDNAPPVLAISISCVGRRLLLGERTEEETEATLSSLPKGSIQIGFYSYGELSPYVAGNCELHNQTMTITTFYESSTS